MYDRMEQYMKYKKRIMSSSKSAAFSSHIILESLVQESKPRHSIIISCKLRRRPKAAAVTQNLIAAAFQA